MVWVPKKVQKNLRFHKVLQAFSLEKTIVWHPYLRQQFLFNAKGVMNLSSCIFCSENLKQLYQKMQQLLTQLLAHILSLIYMHGHTKGCRCNLQQVKAFFGLFRKMGKLLRVQVLFGNQFSMREHNSHDFIQLLNSQCRQL